MRQAGEALFKWLVVSALQLALMTASLAAAPWLADEIGAWWSEAPSWRTFALWLSWLGSGLVTQLLLVTVVRKVQAGAVLYAETFRPHVDGSDGRALRRRTAGRVLAAGCVLLGAWIAVVAAWLRPPWPVVVLLLLGLIAAGRGAGRAVRAFDAVCTSPEMERL